VGWREYMWILDGWRRITGMPQSEQGVALALSVSGRAAPIAQSIAHDTLQQPWGLSYLIWRLEQCFGREEQDLQRSRFDNIKRLHRRKGESAKDFLIRFELTLWEGEKSGASYSPTSKAHTLLTAAASWWRLAWYPVGLESLADGEPDGDATPLPRGPYPNG
jgi:hypothetical protein